jgi:hypothetical protein
MAENQTLELLLGVRRDEKAQFWCELVEQTKRLIIAIHDDLFIVS